MGISHQSIKILIRGVSPLINSQFNLENKMINQVPEKNTHLKKIIIGALAVSIIMIVYTQDKNEPVISSNQSEDIMKLNNEIRNLKTTIETIKNNQYGNLENNFISSSNEDLNQIALLKKQFSDMKKQMSDISKMNNNQVESNVGVSNNNDNNLTYAQELQQQELKNSQIENLYISTIQTEQQDPQWSVNTEEKTRQSLTQLNDKIDITNLECKTSLCRLDFKKHDEVADENLMDDFETNLNWDGAMEITYNPKTGEATIYMARDGYNMPQLEN